MCFVSAKTRLGCKSQNLLQFEVLSGTRSQPPVKTKDHVYRMVIVEGCCTMARLSSLGANCSLVDTKV